MADIEVLDRVKSALGISGTYQDNTLSVYIDEVISYMISAGVPEKVAISPLTSGVIARGVNDLWLYGSSNADFSDYFRQRVAQLSYRAEGE